MSHDIDQEAPEALKSLSEPPLLSTGDSTSNMDSFSAPFSDDDDVIFFAGADRRMLLDEVVHLCQFGNNLVALLGDEGVGKTTFLSQARYELAETAFCCFISSEASMSAEDIFRQIISQLELPATPSPSAGEMIATLRHSMAEGNLNRVVVIIDDAHLLSDSILSALISLLQGHQGNHFHVLLGGDKNLVERLDQFEIVDVLVYDITLNPFSLEETQEYLDFRLSTAGEQDAYDIEPVQLESLWKQSKGYPAAINQAAHTFLLQQDMGDHLDLNEEQRSRGLPLVHMVLLVVLLAALIMALIYLGDDEEPSKVAEPEIKILEAPSVPEAVSVDADKAASPVGNEPNQAVNTANLIESESLKTEVIEEAPKLDEVLKPANTEVVVASKPDVVSEKVDEIKSVIPNSDTGQKVPSAPEVTAEKEAQPSVVNSAKEELKKELEQEAKALKASNVVEPKSSEVKAMVSLTPDEQQVMGWPDGSYALQVIAAGQKSGLDKFVASQPNKSDLRLIKVIRNNKPWYVVVVGVFSDSSQARNAIQSLPQNQVNGKPWPRKVLDIKKDIKAVRNN